MSNISLKDILNSIPYTYYIVDIDSYYIIETNQKDVKKGTDFCYKMIFNYEAPCNVVNNNVDCVCKLVKEKSEKVEITQSFNIKGEEKLFKVTANPIVVNGIKTKKIIIQYVDITKEDRLSYEHKNHNSLKKPEVHIRNKDIQNEEDSRKISFLNTITKQVTNAIITTDINFNINWVNDAFEKMYGYSLKEVFGLKPDLLNAEPNSVEIQQNIYKELGKGHTYNGTSLNIRKDKSTFYCNYKIYPIYGNNKKVIAYGSILEDITELKKLEQEKERIERVLEESSKLAKIGGWELDVKTMTSYYTDETKRIYGIPLESMPPPGIEGIKFYPEEVQSLIQNKVTDAIEKGKPYDIEVPFINAQGENLWVRTICRVVQENGKTVKLYGTFQDITVRKKAEIKLTKNENALQRIINITGEKSKDDYFNSMVVALNEVFSADYVYIGELINKNSVSTIALSKNGKVVENINYSLENTPCEQVVLNEICVYSSNIQKKFPHDYLLKELEIEGYVGIPLINSSGIRLGILVALFKTKIRDVEFVKSICEVFAGNIIAELDRTKTENDLKDSENKFRSYLNNAPLGIFVTNKKGKFLEVNPKACSITEYSEKELLEMNVVDLISKDSIKDAEYYIKTCITKGHSIGEHSYITKNGEKRFWRIDALMISPSRILSFVTDTTDALLARNALLESEEKFKVLSESAPMAVMMFQNDKWVYMNPKAIEITGYSKKELSQMNFWDFIHPDFSDVVKKRGKDRQSGKNAPYNYDIKVLTKMGEEKWVSIYGASTIYGGKPAAIVSVLDITDLKNVELALIDSEKKLRNITENSTNVFYQHDVEGYLTFITPQIKDILGYSVDEALVKWTELTSDHPINLEGVKNTEKAIKTGEIQPAYELELVHKSGKKIWVEVREAPLIEKGKTVAIVGALSDINEKKKAEEALRNSEKLYRKLFESANVGIGISTVEGNILAANNAMTRIFGYSNDEFLNVINIKSLYSNIKDRYLLLQEVERNGEIRNMQIVMISKGGKEKWVHISAQKINLIDDNRLLFVISDITKEKNAEIELQKQEAKFRTYIESSPTAVLMVDKNGNYKYVNEAVSKLLGYTKDEILELAIPDIKVTKRKQDIYKDFEELKEKGILRSREITYRAKNGELVQVVIDSVKLSENEYMAFCTDVSQLKAYERKLKNKNEEYLALNEEMQDYIVKLQKLNVELQEAKQKAEESDRLKSAFLANMSHELRTPLNGILGFSALMQKENLPKESMLRYSTIIETSGKRLLTVVNDLFDISLIHSNQLKIDMAEFNVNELLEDVELFYKTIQKDKMNNVNFSIKLGSPHNIKIYNDKYRVHQIFKNLIDNAFKFTSEGQIEAGYEIKSEKKIRFYVKDTGIGISKEDQEKIFSSFKQVDDSITRDYEGAGLGLAICAGLLERMGGSIEVVSEKNKGAEFYFELPLKSNIDKKNIILKDKSILIVEDDLTNYVFLKRNLESIGGSGLIHTSNGEEAVKIIESKKIDLVLMNIRLPGIDGYETARRIRRIDNKVKIIAQSVYAIDDEIKSIDAGCNYHIFRPIDDEELLRIVKNVMD